MGTHGDILKVKIDWLKIKKKIALRCDLVWIVMIFVVVIPMIQVE